MRSGIAVLLHDGGAIVKHPSLNVSYFPLSLKCAVCTLALLAVPCVSAQEILYFATAETPTLGTQTSGNLESTQAADGTAEKLAEAKDDSGNYRLEWAWHFDVPPGADTGADTDPNTYQLILTAQATNSKQGMDSYEFRFLDDSGVWQSLGTASQTTMSSYAWEFPSSYSGGSLTVSAIDTNRSDDPRRANQLWLDLLAVAEIKTPSDGGGGTGGSGGSGGSGGDSTVTGPDTDRIIAGYYPSWAIYSAREYWVRYIPFDRVTHVYYAFANVDPDTYAVIIGDSFAELTNRKDPETGNGLPAGNLNQLTYFRDVGHNGPAYRHLKVIISVGGWSWSGNLSDAASSPENRWRFASSLNDFVNTYGLDGADIDWEFPTGDLDNCGLEGNVCREGLDPLNHALLIMACRLMLGTDKELSIAMPAGARSIAAIMPALVDDPALLHDSALYGEVIMTNPSDANESFVVDENTPRPVDMLDYIHVMNYDNAGASWLDTTRHHAALFGYGGETADPADPDSGLAEANGHFAIQAYLNVRRDYSGFDPDDPVAEVGTIDPSKLTLGIPMYGRGFSSVDSGDHDGFVGLFQFTDSSERRRTPKGTWDGGKWGNTGVFAYWDLLLRMGGDSSLVHTVGPFGENDFYGTYLFDGDLFVGFDNLYSVEQKVNYVLQQKLAGVMFWDFPGDVSEAQVAAGVTGARDAHPSQSLIYRIAETLEAASAQ